MKTSLLNQNWQHRFRYQQPLLRHGKHTRTGCVRAFFLFYLKGPPVYMWGAMVMFFKYVDVHHLDEKILIENLIYWQRMIRIFDLKNRIFLKLWQHFVHVYQKK